jgi:hypothetical protein
METPATNRRDVLHTLAAGGLAAAVLAVTTRSANAAEKHPHIRAALKELKEARVELKEGDKIFGGHREKALKAVDEAIEQLDKALEFAEK